MKKCTFLLITALAFTGCKSTPNLYSAVLPMSNGTYETTTTANSKSKSLTRATRNAERYCDSINKNYIVITINKKYDGLLQNEKAASTVNKALSVASAGIISPNTNTDYITELTFKCLNN